MYLQFLNRSRTFYTTNELPRLFNDVFLRLKGIIAAAPYMSFTSDGWESRDHKHSILSLTCHFLDEDFSPKFFVLDAASIIGFFFVLDQAHSKFLKVAIQQKTLPKC